MASLYERLGGLEPIASVVDSFVARCASDGRINRKFERTDVPRLKKMLVDQVCEATGGPCTYTGRGMRPTHDGMAVTAGEFDALVEDLVLTLGELMLSPMGLSLVSKVAPTRFRGVMMGGWFVATGLGNKLTQIAVFWTEWRHSTFWLTRCIDSAPPVAVVNR